MVERATTDQLKREQDQRDRMRWLAEQRTRDVQEGSLHHGLSAVVQVVARKPA